SSTLLRIACLVILYKTSQPMEYQDRYEDSRHSLSNAGSSSRTRQRPPSSGTWPCRRGSWCRRRDRSIALALDYLSQIKKAVMVRQLDVGHIVWCGRVVRVERAHRVRVVRRVQKMPDVGNGVIGFDHVRFHVRDLVMAFLEDELVRCGVTHHRARDFGIVKM